MRYLDAGIYSSPLNYVHLRFAWKFARLRRPKIACSPSYVDYRSKTNAVILLDMGHTLRGECVQEE
jgi:hypothetical protein